MTFQSKEFRDKKALVIIYDEKTNYESFLAGIEYILSEVKDAGITNVLSDVTRVPSMKDVLEIYTLIEKLSKGTPAGMKFAAVIPGKGMDIRLEHLVETFTDNRGLILRFFTDFDLACEWLGIDPRKSK